VTEIVRAIGLNMREFFQECRVIVAIPNKLSLFRLNEQV
tara:strand:- start:689 stop:805 length:117 start_codon:yes stop_codon:yes gene_type:complete